jgi:Na+-driven multidrug efflux pump
VNWILLGGLGIATSVLVGQYLGASSPERASSVSRHLIMAGFGIQIVSTVLYWYFAGSLIAVMDPNPQTVEPGMAFMRWVVLGFLVSTPGGLAISSMNGAGDTMPGMIAGIVGNWLVKLPLAWALSRMPVFLLNGVWHAMFISLIVEGAMGLFWYRRGRWMKKIGSAEND